MWTFLPRNSTNKGVLLMEALVALLLFMSMSTIIGTYWHYLALIRSDTQSRLEALSVAQNAAHALIINHEQIYIKNNHNIQYEPTPVAISSDLDISMPSMSLITIHVVDTKNRQISLKTFYGE